MEQNNQQNLNKQPNIFPIKIILLGIIIILITTVTIGLGVFYLQKKPLPQSLGDSENNALQINLEGWKSNPEDVYIPPIPQYENNFNSAPAPNTYVEWFGEPNQIDSPSLILGYQDDYNSSSTTENVMIKYYELGVHSGNKIILAIAPAIDPSGQALFFFEKTSGDEYVLMQKMSSYSVYGYGSLGYGSDLNMPNAGMGSGYVLSSKIKSADNATYYYDVVGPEMVNYKGLILRQQYLYPTYLFVNYAEEQKSEGSVLKKINNIKEGEIYLNQQIRAIPSEQSGALNNLAKFYMRFYVLKLPSGLLAKYGLSYIFFSDNSVPAITWNDGSKNQDKFRTDASLSGCGTPGSYIVSANDISANIKQSGTTSTGELIFEFKDINNPVLRFFYDYQGGQMYNPITYELEPVSIEFWYNLHPVIVYKNAVGDYEIFVNEKFGGGAECGKPVIYLYPTKSTSVKVQVGANITKSEPSYRDGWRVLANPDGTLTTQDGKKHESLFWEGIGYGNYPTITGGFVVPQAELKNTIEFQLKKLGLNDKESIDFLEFWLPKMPKDPYVRLTWFTTEKLNNLAPLIIMPRPDTVIRIFLDFQGLKNKISLPEQNLIFIPRKGFTVVEWGGILRK